MPPYRLIYQNEDGGEVQEVNVRYFLFGRLYERLFRVCKSGRRIVSISWFVHYAEDGKKYYLLRLIWSRT